jgi:hypothetical protein
MAVVVDLHDAARNVRSKPVAVARRDEDVGSAVADEHRHGDLRDIEAPRADEREHVVCPAVDAVHRMLEDRLAEGLHRLRARETLAVGLVHVVVLEHVRDVVGRRLRLVFRLHALELRDECVLAFQYEAELSDVCGIHPVEPGVGGEPRRPVRCRSDHAGRANDAFGETCGARERVRAAS